MAYRGIVFTVVAEAAINRVGALLSSLDLARRHSKNITFATKKYFKYNVEKMYSLGSHVYHLTTI